MLTRLECVVHRRVAAAQRALAGLYLGNPKRKMTRPTAERLLEAFEEPTLTIICEERHRHYHLTPLSASQQQILALLDFRVDIYTQLGAAACKPP